MIHPPLLKIRPGQWAADVPGGTLVLSDAGRYESTTLADGTNILTDKATRSTVDVMRPDQGFVLAKRIRGRMCPDCGQPFGLEWSD